MRKNKSEVSHKNEEDCQGNILGEGVGAAPSIFFFFLHAEGVEEWLKI